MLSFLLCLLTLGAKQAAAEPHRPTDDRAAFVTVLGRDTVALESYTRTASRLEGDMVVRVPGTVHLHYVLQLGADGAVARSTVDVTPLGTSEVARRRVTLDFVRDSVRVTVDSAGVRQRATVAVEKGTVPLLMSGFGSSYGLYGSLGMYELLFSRLPSRPNDTVAVASIGAASGRPAMRRLVRRSATRIDVDFFRIAWTHLTLDADGNITGADASETTEKTETRRTEYFDVARAAKGFAARDRSGTGIGVASPNQTVSATLGSTAVVVAFGSPRRRGREILGRVVPYGEVWRTGANEASVLVTDGDLTIGGVEVPAGAYSLWTLPKRDGVELIINRQHGQWGTQYDASQDLARLPMRVAPAPEPRESFAITVSPTTAGAGELRILWDSFVWSVPVVAR